MKSWGVFNLLKKKFQSAKTQRNNSFNLRNVLSCHYVAFQGVTSVSGYS